MVCQFRFSSRGARQLAGLGLFLLALETPAKTWIVPGVISGVGRNGAFFFTEITLVNPGSLSQSVTLIPIGPPGSPISDPVGLTLGPGESRLIPGLAPLGGGALQIQAAGDLGIFARTNSTTGAIESPPPSPVRGSSLPVVEEGSLLQSGQTGHSTWVSHSSDSSVGERTNIALVLSGAATITLFDDRGTVLGSAHYDVTRPAFIQASVNSLTAGSVPVGRISLAVTRGTACGYTGVVDNVTGDLAIVPIDLLPGGPRPSGRLDLISTGVAQIGGSNGRLWHTDARLANPGSASVTVNAFLLGGSQTASLSVPPGQTVEILDTVQSLFGFSGPFVGAILWRADGPLLVSARTRQRESLPVTASPGVLAAVSLDRFRMNTDPAGTLGDLRQSDVARTNLMAAAGAAGATFDLDLFEEGGRLLGTTVRTLPPLGWEQSPLGRLFPGVFNAALAQPRTRLQLRVETGSVHVTASVVDDFSNDAVYFNAMPGVVRVPPSSPPIPAGEWGGAPNGRDHLIVDASSVSIFRQCQSGTFPQPPVLDAGGNFAVLGSYVVSIGPGIQFDAILSGQSDGHSATVRVLPIANASPLLDANPETFVLGAPFLPFIGVCPIEY